MCYRSATCVPRGPKEGHSSACASISAGASAPLTEKYLRPLPHSLTHVATMLPLVFLATYCEPFPDTVSPADPPADRRTFTSPRYPTRPSVPPTYAREHRVIYHGAVLAWTVAVHQYHSHHDILVGIIYKLGCNWGRTVSSVFEMRTTRLLGG
jgi:hypothetical protein